MYKRVDPDGRFLHLLFSPAFIATKEEGKADAQKVGKERKTKHGGDQGFNHRVKRTSGSP